ncbi:hypothetical protein JW933_00125 [candidate division FCPU426 bacterium]|nr:hypothetical protein [candidate division FCPU426 bacterium]
MRRFQEVVFPARIFSFITALCLFSLSAAADTNLGDAPGNAGDSNPATFHFDPDNADFQMTRADGAPISLTDVPLLYGTEFVIYQDGQDYAQTRGLTVIGADLSGAQMNNANFPPPGTVAIDPATGRFKFAGVRWYEIQRLDRDPSVNSWISNAVINDNRVVMVDLKEYVSAAADCYSKYYTPATGWSSAEVINITDDVNGNEFGIDANGKVLCTINYGNTPQRLYLMSYTAGSGWSTPAFLDEGSPYANQTPRLAMNAAGDALAGFLESPASTAYPYGRHYIANVGWESNVRIDALVNTCYADNIKVDINKYGDGVAVYRQENYFASTGWHLYGNIYLKAGGGWQAQAPVATLTDHHFAYPDVAINDQGDAICVTYGFDSGPAYYVYAIHYQAGVGWQTPQRLYTYVSVPGSPYFQPYVVMDNQGNALCIFMDTLGGIRRLLAMHYSPAEGWTGPVYVDKTTGGAITARYPSLDMTNDGFAVCGFSQEEIPGSSYGRSMVNCYHPQDGWQSPQILDIRDASASDTVMALNEVGDGIMAFNQTDGSYLRAYARFFENDIPGANIQTQYSYIPAATPTPTVPPLPSQANATFRNRKIQPLLGESLQVEYTLIKAGVVRLAVYSLKGEKVIQLLDDLKDPGTHQCTWNGKTQEGQRVASGVYIVTLKAPGLDEKQKVVVIK